MNTMASLHPISVIAQQLLRGDTSQAYRHPAVTTARPVRQPTVRPASAPASEPRQRPVIQPSRPAWAHRFGHLLVHPLSTLRTH
jgi:hypothetical protein